MSDNCTIMVVNASQRQKDKFRAHMPDWRIREAEFDPSGTVRLIGEPEPISHVLVFALNEKEETLALCRNAQACAGQGRVPLLLAISRYQIALGNVARRLERTDFIIRPFTTAEVCDKLHALSAESTDSAREA